jgi:glycosyltransferase involved in cell wall biosynthesis
VPVIGAAVGGIPAVIVDGESGRLVEPERPAAIARALIELGVDPILRAKLGAAAGERAMAFSTDVSGARLVALYAELLSGC